MKFGPRLSAWLFPQFKPEERRILWIQVLLIFTINTLLYIGIPATREWRRLAEERHMYTIMRAWDGPAWYVWIFAVPAMQMLIRRYPLARGQIRANLMRLLFGNLVLYLVITNLRYFFHVLPDIFWASNHDALWDAQTYVFNTYGMVALDGLTYSGFFAVSFSVDYYFRHRRRVDQARELQLEAARLQSDLARAELAALRGQLQPHFLFNSFNALSTLVRQRKSDQAVEIIAQLSELLRLAIERGALQEVPLQQEMDFIQRYLEIERLRYGDKLRTHFAVESDTMNLLVPNIVLQPLVENAIKHAISLRTNPGLVHVAARQANGRLLITVTDDGPENPPPPIVTRKRPGIGLANSRAQLEKLYGRDYRLEILKRAEREGTMIQLDLPARPATLLETPCHEKIPNIDRG